MQFISDKQWEHHISVFIWKTTAVMNVALAEQRCGSEGHSGGRETYVGVRTDICAGEAAMFADKRREAECVRIQVRGEREEGWSELLQRRSAFMCITFSLCGGYMWLTKTQADMPHMRTQGNETQSRQAAGCPAENNHSRIHFDVYHLFTVCAFPLSFMCDCEIFPFSASGDLQSPPASLLYSLPPLLSDLISHHHTWLEKQRKTRQWNVYMWIFTVDFTLSRSAFCFSLVFLYARHSVFLYDAHFINCVCQRLSLNPFVFGLIYPVAAHYTFIQFWSS